MPADRNTSLRTIVRRRGVRSATTPTGSWNTRSPTQNATSTRVNSKSEARRPLLTVKGLKPHFQTEEGTVRAVDGVDFTLGEGESLGLAGESGCGKTTAALSIMRLLPSNGKIVEGTIDYVGYDLAKVTEGQLRGIRWKHISIIFQGAMNALNPVKRIGDQIAEPIVIHDKVDKEVAMKRVGELLELVGIHRERAREYPHEFSGGMRQRVMIAMALACNPRIVIADDAGVHPGPLPFVDQSAARVPFPSAVQVCVAAVRRPGTRPRSGRSGPLRRMPPEHDDAAEGGDVRWPASRTLSSATSASGSRSGGGSSRRCRKPPPDTVERSVGSTSPSGGGGSSASSGR